MPATLRSLLDRHDLALRLLTEGVATDVPVSWLHSSDLDDPTPFLSPGQALLTTGTQFGEATDGEPDPAAVDAYVARLVDRGVVALGFGTEVVRAGTPDALVTACRASGLPLFEVPYETSFIALTQANAETLAREANARNAWALAAQRAISLAAMRPDGLGATLAELSRQLDCWVGLFDVSGRLDRSFPDGGVTAEELDLLGHEAARLLRSGQRASLPVRTDRTGFSLQTLGAGGHLHGVLAIATGGPLDQAGREVVTAVIALAGLALQQNRELGRARGLLRTGLLTMLSSGTPTVADAISREIWGPLPAEPIRVAAIDVEGHDAQVLVDVLELRALEHPGTLFFALDDALFLCVGADDADTVRGFVAEADLHAGVSNGGDYRHFARARREAAQALDRSRERGSSVVEFGELARDGVLAFVRQSDASEVARTFLAPVSQHDRDSGSEVERTLRTWLEQDCSLDRTADALGVHRHTARARIELAGRLLDRDLSRLPTRADTWAAFVALDAVTPESARQPDAGHLG